jgi:hypothetical protein
MKVRINFDIDVTKLDKARFYHGKKGIYCNMSALVDLDNLDQYGNSGFITQAKKKEEPKELKLPILGNSKVVWREGAEQQQEAGMNNAYQQMSQQQAPETNNFDDDISF